MKRATLDPAKNIGLYFRKLRSGSILFRFKDVDGDDYNLADTFYFQSGFAAALTKVDNTLTLSINPTQSNVSRDTFFWEIVNSTTGKTWLCGTAYFTTADSAEIEDTEEVITINTAGTTIEVTLEGVGSSVSQYRGAYDASGGTFPGTDGSGDGGAIRGGDMWSLSVGGELDGQDWPIGTLVTALEDVPGQDVTKWRLI